MDEIKDLNESAEEINTNDSAYQKRKKKERTKRYILRSIELLIVGFLVMCLTWALVTKFTSKYKVSSLFGYSSLTIISNSMTNTIDKGDSIIIKKQKSYNVDDIITFVQTGDKIPTTHKIISINEDGSYVTKGDYNTSTDKDPIKEEQVLGKVVKVIKNGGLFQEWLTKENGLIYIILGVGIIVAAIFVIRKPQE